MKENNADNNFKYEITKRTGDPLYNWKYFGMDHQLNLISGFIEQCEKSNKAAYLAYKEFENGIKNSVSSEKEEYPVDPTIYNGMSDSEFYLHSVYKEDFPSLNRNSNFILILSMFERKMKVLCKLLKESMGLYMDLKNYEENEKKKRIDSKKIPQLLTFKGYFIDVAKLEFTVDLNKYWSDLEILQKIRNNIVHNFGSYIVQDISVTNFIELNDHIKIIEVDRPEIDSFMFEDSKSKHDPNNATIVNYPNKEFSFDQDFLSEIILFFRGFSAELEKVIQQRIDYLDSKVEVNK